VLGCLVKHAWRGIRGAHVRTRPSGQRRPARLWNVVACVCGRWRMISILIIRTLSCTCSVPLARHGDTGRESGTRCAAHSTNLQRLGHGVGWDREVAPFAACCLVVWSWGGWGRAVLCGESCVARHPGCTRLHAFVRSAPAGAAVARGGFTGLWVGGQRCFRY